MNKFFELLKKLNNPGISFPLAYNPVTNKPSVTLFFAIITFILAVISTILLHFKAELLIATTTSITFWVLALVFYRLGKLDAVKINLKDQSLDLHTDNKENNNES